MNTHNENMAPEEWAQTVKSWKTQNNGASTNAHSAEFHRKMMGIKLNPLIKDFSANARQRYCDFRNMQNKTATDGTNKSMLTNKRSAYRKPIHMINQSFSVSRKGASSEELNKSFNFPTQTSQLKEISNNQIQTIDKGRKKLNQIKHKLQNEEINNSTSAQTLPDIELRSGKKYSIHQNNPNSIRIGSSHYHHVFNQNKSINFTSSFTSMAKDNSLESATRLKNVKIKMAEIAEANKKKLREKEKMQLELQLKKQMEEQRIKEKIQEEQLKKDEEKRKIRLLMKKRIQTERQILRAVLIIQTNFRKYLHKKLYKQLVEEKYNKARERLNANLYDLNSKIQNCLYHLGTQTTESAIMIQKCVRGFFERKRTHKILSYRKKIPFLFNLIHSRLRNKFINYGMNSLVSNYEEFKTKELEEMEAEAKRKKDARRRKRSRDKRKSFFRILSPRGGGRSAKNSEKHKSSLRTPRGESSFLRKFPPSADNKPQNWLRKPNASMTIECTVPSINLSVLSRQSSKSGKRKKRVSTYSLNLPSEKTANEFSQFLTLPNHRHTKSAMAKDFIKGDAQNSTSVQESPNSMILDKVKLMNGNDLFSEIISNTQIGNLDWTPLEKTFQSSQGNETEDDARGGNLSQIMEFKMRSFDPEDSPYFHRTFENSPNKEINSPKEDSRSPKGIITQINEFTPKKQFKEATKCITLQPAPISRSPGNSSLSPKIKVERLEEKKIVAAAKPPLPNKEKLKIIPKLTPKIQSSGERTQIQIVNKKNERKENIEKSNSSFQNKQIQSHTKIEKEEKKEIKEKIRNCPSGRESKFTNSSKGRTPGAISVPISCQSRRNEHEIQDLNSQNFYPKLQSKKFKISKPRISKEVIRRKAKNAIISSPRQNEFEKNKKLGIPASIKKHSNIGSENLSEYSTIEKPKNIQRKSRKQLSEKKHSNINQDLEFIDTSFKQKYEEIKKQKSENLLQRSSSSSGKMAQGQFLDFFYELLNKYTEMEKHEKSLVAARYYHKYLELYQEENNSVPNYGNKPIKSISQPISHWESDKLIDMTAYSSLEEEFKKTQKAEKVISLIKSLFFQEFNQTYQDIAQIQSHDLQKMDFEPTPMNPDFTMVEEETTPIGFQSKYSYNQKKEVQLQTGSPLKITNKASKTFKEIFPQYAEIIQRYSNNLPKYYFKQEQEQMFRNKTRTIEHRKTSSSYGVENKDQLFERKRSLNKTTYGNRISYETKSPLVNTSLVVKKINI